MRRTFAGRKLILETGRTIRAVRTHASTPATSASPTKATATARRAVAQLTEMLADDAALKTHDRTDLVRAIVLTGEAEGAARGTSGQDPHRTMPNVQEDGSVPLTLRFYRLLDPARPLPLPVRLAVIVAALGLTSLPVALLVQM